MNTPAIVIGLFSAAISAAFLGSLLQSKTTCDRALASTRPSVIAADRVREAAVLEECGTFAAQGKAMGDALVPRH